MKLGRSENGKMLRPFKKGLRPLMFYIYLQVFESYLDLAYICLPIKYIFINKFCYRSLGDSCKAEQIPLQRCNISLSRWIFLCCFWLIVSAESSLTSEQIIVILLALVEFEFSFENNQIKQITKKKKKILFQRNTYSHF